MSAVELQSLGGVERVRVRSMRTLLAAKLAVEAAEQTMWLTARQALDQGETPEDVAAICLGHGRSARALYEQLRKRGLTYGRGAVSRLDY